MINLSALFFVVATGASGHKVDDTSFVGIFAETHAMRIAGVKVRPMPKLPPGISIPASARAMMSGAPTRTLTVRLYAPLIAPDDATASIAPPAGLKLGDKLNLELYRAKPE